MRKKIFLVALCIGLLLLACSPNNLAGGSTETTNARVLGILYNPDGTRAAHAVVHFVPVDHNPRAGLAKLLAVTDSTTTDDTGAYKIDSLPVDTYNVFGKNGTDLSYQDSIKIKTDSQTIVPPDTLKAPGSISGAIRLQGADDARTVFILFMGTNTWATPDDSTGKFTVANMAEGIYRVRILTTLDAYLPKDTVLSVTAGKVDSLTRDITLQYTGIPVVSGLTISYDTLKQIVTLIWSKPTTGRTVTGYNIYRKFQSTDSSFVKIKSDVADTIYKDSTGLQDQTYSYQVTVVDTNGTEGVRSETNIVTISTEYVLIKTIGTRGTAAGQFNIPTGIAMRNDTIFIVENGNKRVQVMDTTGKSLLTFNATLVNPQAISVLGNKIYVADNANIKIYDLTGILLKTIPVSYGAVRGIKAITEDSILVVETKNIYWIDTTGAVLDSSNYSFDYPKKIASMNSSIIVTDQNVRKLVFLNHFLSFKKEITIINTPYTGSRGNAVLSVSASSQNIYVGALIDSGKVIVLDSNGNYIARFTVFSDPGDFTYPENLFATNSALYVASSNSTIQVYKRR